MNRAIFLVGAAGAAAACARTGPARAFDVLDPSAQPLRGRFDAQRDKVRVLMLVSPT